jgi:LacI family transcriptional regulator
MAAAVIFVARERGITVPQELSVVGFDDTPIAAHIWPPLTTVRWPIVSMGRAAAGKLIHGFGGERAGPDEALFPSTFVHRQSVAPPAS